MHRDMDDEYPTIEPDPRYTPVGNRHRRAQRGNRTNVRHRAIRVSQSGR
jgi:hypothetical protein